jgi:hypothetical protein
MWKVSGLALALAIAATHYSGPAAASCEQLRSACYTKCGSCCVCGSHWTLHCCLAGEFGDCGYVNKCRANCGVRYQGCQAKGAGSLDAPAKR